MENMENLNFGFVNQKEKKLGIVVLISSIIAFLLICFLIIAAIGRIKKTDDGIMYKRFFVPVKEKWVTRGDKTYYFDKSGYAITGWGDVDDNTYLFGKDGVMYKGWYEEDDKKYYLDEKNGVLAKGFVTVDDKPYYFSTEDGELQTGIIKVDDRIIASSDDNGVLHTGTNDIEGAVYCFNAYGEAKTGWTVIDNNTYYCQEDGTVATGMINIEDEYYCFDENGILKKGGWIEDFNGKKCYASDDGKLYRGKNEVDGKKYYFDDDGVLLTGWINTGAERFYAGDDGVLFTGEQEISGVKFNFDENGAMISQNSDGTKMIALTFDDGPSVNTDAILDVLEEFGVKATFFVVGSRVPSYTSQLKRENDLGCEIGSHTYNHSYLTKLSPEEMQNEIDQTNQVVAQVTGHETTCIRPPGGFYNDEVIKRINCPIAMWNVDTLDWKSRNAQSVAGIATTNIKDGDIILMHDLYSSTAEAVRTIVPALISQGFQIVTVSELLNAKCQNGAVNGMIYYASTDVRTPK